MSTTVTIGPEWVQGGCVPVTLGAVVTVYTSPVLDPCLD